MKKRDSIKGMCISLSAVHNTIDSLSSSFVWRKTREGDKYWKKIISRLEEIKKKGGKDGNTNTRTKKRKRRV